VSAALLLQAADAAPPAGWWGPRETVFAVLFVVMSLLYWLNYRRDESLPGSALKVLGLLTFVYSTMRLMDWIQAKVPVEQTIRFGLSWPAVTGPVAPRIPLLADIFFWFVIVLLLAVLWYARRKITTVGALVLSTWDRGHWYMLPVIFIMLTLGLLLVAAAASPVLSPFIYTLF
jgi:hypothetical protein